MHIRTWVLGAALLDLAAAQSDDPLTVVVPFVWSIFTEASSIVGSIQSVAATATTNTPSSASASTTRSTSSTSSTTSTSSSSSSTTPSSTTSATSSMSPTSTTSSATATSITSSPSSIASNFSPTSSPTAAAASATSTSNPSGSGGSTNKLAIILGCVLGGLALGLLILVLLLCLRRRRRRRDSRLAKDIRSPDDSEVDTWRSKESRNVSYRDVATTGHHPSAAVVAAPVMGGTRHTDYDDSRENTLTGTTSAPRLTAPNARPGLTDGMVPGDEPYLTGNSTTPPRTAHDPMYQRDHHHSGGLGTAAGAAALGATAMHHHEHNHRHSNLDHEPPTAAPVPGEGRGRSGLMRKPVPISDQSVPYQATANTIPHAPEPVTAAHGVGPAVPVAAHLAEGGRKRSGDRRRRSLTRDAARANAAFDQHTPTPPPDHHPGLGAGAAGIVGGAAAGAALAHHHNQRNSTSRSPHRRSFLTSKNRDSDLSNSSETSDSYRDAIAAQSSALDNSGHVNPSTAATTPSSAPVKNTASDPYDIPPTPPIRSRPNSMLGTAAPAAAAFSYHNEPEGRRSTSREGRRLSQQSMTGGIPLEGAARGPGPAPMIPSRSPRRISFADEEAVVDDNDLPYLDNIPYHNAPTGQQPSNPTAAGPKGLVGDSRYPHMNVPHRRSGGEYDMEQHGPLGPQRVLNPHASIPNPTTGSSTEASDDSTWRMSQGMPGAWGRANTTNSPRRSLDANRLSGAQSRQPYGALLGAGGGNGAANLDNPYTNTNSRYSGIDPEPSYFGGGPGEYGTSGKLPYGSTLGPNMGSGTGKGPGMGAGVGANGGRLRLADLQREEEMRELDRQRLLEQGQAGRAGQLYDGYDASLSHHPPPPQHHQHGHGVGQAL